MKNVFAHFKNYRLSSILAPTFKLLEALIDLFVPLVVSSLIDKGISANDVSYIIKMVLIIIGLAFIGLGFSLLGQFFAAKSAIGVSSSIKVDLFTKVQRLSFNEIDKLGPSSLVTRMTSDMNQIQTGINMFLRLLLRSPFIVFGAAIMAFSIAFYPSLVFVGAILVLGSIVALITLKTIPGYKKAQGQLDVVLNSTKENLTGVRVIRAFGNEESEQEAYNNYTSELKKQQIHVNNISALLNPLTYCLINLAICGLIYISGIEVNVGSLTQGQVIALYNYMSQILVELIKLANMIVTLTKSLACAKRVDSILSMNSTLIQGRGDDVDDTAYINFSHVSVRYKGAQEDALTDINFTVNKGETIGIIGGTGSGKSTLVNLLSHFYDVSSGALYLDGKNINSYDLKELREKVGVVLQKASLFRGTIISNIRWGKKDATEEEVNEALEIAQATNIISSKSNGLYEEVEQNGRNFSGGQKQRLSIARAIVKKPEILIFDDSSSALDYATDLALRKALKKLKDTTIFIVAQRTASLQSCSKIVVLDDGKMVGFDTHENLLKNNEVYQDIYYSQFKKEGK
ncbi:MAG: ABC transporter ATP-binding protein [Bacilli bacterium]